MADTAERTVPEAVRSAALDAWLRCDDQSFESVLGTYCAVLADPGACAALLGALDPRWDEQVRLTRRAQGRANGFREALESIEAHSPTDPGGCDYDAGYDAGRKAAAEIARNALETADGPRLPERSQ